MLDPAQNDPTDLAPSALLRAALCDACRRGIEPGLEQSDALRVFRSVVSLARAVRLAHPALPSSPAVRASNLAKHPLHRVPDPRRLC